MIYRLVCVKVNDLAGYPLTYPYALFKHNIIIDVFKILCLNNDI